MSGQSSYVSANLFTPWSQNNGEMNGIVGVSIFDAGISLYGPAQEVFTLAKPIAINKFTRLQYTLTTSNNVQNVGLCLHEELPGEFGINRDQCHELNVSQDIDVAIGELVNGKQTDIKCIGIVQDAPLDGSSTISSISIVQGEKTDIYDDSGCKDPNAITSGSGNTTECTCKDGFVASNGGKGQGQFDTCVRCVLSNLCRFDGETCSSHDECIISSCEGSRCKARVS